MPVVGGRWWVSVGSDTLDTVCCACAAALLVRVACVLQAMMLLSHNHNITRYALDAICNVQLLASADLFLGACERT
jgi:hypothetical protein